MKMFSEFLREHSTKMINFKMIKKKWNYKQKSDRIHMKMQKFVIFV